MNRRFNPISVQQATQDAPTLAALAARAADSQRRLAAVQDLIASDLLAAIQAGAADDESWCLLVQGSAAAAKLRQLTPALLKRLATRGWQVQRIRLKLREHS